MMKLHERLVELHKAKGVTQSEAADGMGLFQDGLSKLERGEELPSLVGLKGIAKYYGISPAELLKGLETWDEVE